MNDVEKTWILAFWLDKEGNKGAYAHTLEHQYLINPNSIKKPVRDGILRFSTGHGWQCRKNPHWKSVFFERFPDWDYLHPEPQACEIYGYQASFYHEPDASHGTMAEAFRELFMPKYNDLDWLAVVVSADEWYPFLAGFERGKKAKNQIPF